MLSNCGLEPILIRSDDDLLTWEHFFDSGRYSQVSAKGEIRVSIWRQGLHGRCRPTSGWKASLDDLMHPCVEEARKRGIQFRCFSLQDCRPMAVTDKLTRGDLDTKDATGHTTDAMINKHYDRRTRKVATGARLPETGEVDLPKPHHLPKFER